MRSFTYSCSQILCGLNLLANRLLFNQALIGSIKRDGTQEHRPPVAPTMNQELGADENVICYMAGQAKDSEEVDDVVDCLSAMGQSGTEDDFYAYTQEWTAAI